MAKKQTKLKLGLVTESNAKYHGDLSAISKSRLAKMAVCPLFLKWNDENPQPPTDDMVFGSALHKWVLEEKTFYKEYIVSPNIDRRTKQGKLDYEEFVKNVGNRQIITQEQFDTITAMKNAIMQNEYAKVLLKGVHEKSMYFVDDLTQERVKARPDCYKIINDNETKKVIVTDLKSCRSALPKDFQHDIVRFAYDLQCATYKTGVSKVLDVPIENVVFIFLAIEKKPPYLMAVYVASQDIFDRGMQLYREYLGVYHQCRETGNWYGLNGSHNIPLDITLPNYLLANNQNIGE